MTTRFETYFQELRATLQRYPGKHRFHLSRRLLQGLQAEMEWAAQQVVRLEREQGDPRPGLERALDILCDVDETACEYDGAALQFGISILEAELKRLNKPTTTDRAVERTRN